MRELKSRGKRIDNGEWVCGDLWQPIRDNQKCAFILRQDNKYEVDPATVGQYTGLKDKAGVEIYEGDILEYFQYSQICSKCAHRDKNMNKVVFNSLGATLMGYRIIDPQSDISELEVIGNIHDNPELLKGV